MACGARLAGGSKAGGKRKGAARDRATRPSIVVTELPYQTNKANFVKPMDVSVKAAMALAGYCENC